MPPFRSKKQSKNLMNSYSTTTGSTVGSIRGEAGQAKQAPPFKYGRPKKSMYDQVLPKVNSFSRSNLQHQQKML